jgi:hypothetical protein
LQQEIAEALDDAARKYCDETPKDEKSDTEVTAPMRAAAKTKLQSFKGQFSKYTAVANPKFENEFLEEVCASFLIPWQFILILYCNMIDNLYPSYRSQSTGATTRSQRCLQRSYSSLQRHVRLSISRSDGFSSGTQASIPVKLSTSLLKASLTENLSLG